MTTADLITAPTQFLTDYMATMEKLVYTDRAHDHLRMDRGVDLDLVGTCAQVTIPIPTQIRFINPMVNPHVNLC